MVTLRPALDAPAYAPLLLSAASGLLWLVGQGLASPWLMTLGFIALLFASWLLQRDPLAPSALFGIFLVFYTVSFPIIVLLGSRLSATDENLLIILRSGLVIYVGVLLGEAVVQWQSPFSCRPWLGLANSPTLGTAALLGAMAMSPLFAYAIVSAMTSGATAKSELGTDNFFTGSLIYVFLCAAYLLADQATRASPARRWPSALLLGAFLVFFLATGERDLFVRVALMVLALWYVLGKISRRQVYLVLIAGLLMIPVTQAAKGLLSYGGGFVVTGDIRAVFSNEFLSQGRNFNWLLERESMIPWVYDNMIINDLKRFVYLAEHSSGSLFGRQFVGSASNVGLGFTMPGMLYIAGGHAAHFLYGILAGLVMALVRSRAHLSGAGIYLYIMVLFSFAYALRADVANLLSGLFKLTLIPVFMFWFGERLLRAAASARAQ